MGERGTGGFIAFGVSETTFNNPIDSRALDCTLGRFG